MVNPLINGLQKDEFLYFITSFWKGGDMGELDRINSVVEKDKYYFYSTFLRRRIKNK
jgi:hypothetical protein